MTRPGIDLDQPAPDRPARDLPERLLTAAMRLLPAGRRDWGRAMRAELASIEAKPERWSFARGCLSAAAHEVHLLRGAVHAVVVLATLATLLAWTTTVGYPPLAAVQFLMVWFLAVAAWEGRRAGMLGPAGDGAAAWMLRVIGYLIAGGIIAVGVTHLHPVTVEATGNGIGLLVIPHITPDALPADRISESRIEIVDPYVLVFVFSGLAATSLALANVVTRRPRVATA